MLVVDASCLYEVVAATELAPRIARHLTADEDQFAPHLIDVEVFGVIRRHHQLGHLDGTAARLAIDDLRDWPGERISHTPLLARAWELRTTVRGPDAMYVALAEVLDAPLLTTDARLSRAPGPRCEVVLPTPAPTTGTDGT